MKHYNHAVELAGEQPAIVDAKTMAIGEIAKVTHSTNQSYNAGDFVMMVRGERLVNLGAPHRVCEKSSIDNLSVILVKPGEQVTLTVRVAR